MDFREEGRITTWRNKEDTISSNVRIKGRGTYMAEGKFVQWKSRFLLDKQLENFKEEDEYIGYDRLMTDGEIHRAQWKNWGKEVRIGERLTHVQV